MFEDRLVDLFCTSHKHLQTELFNNLFDKVEISITKNLENYFPKIFLQPSKDTTMQLKY